MNVACTACPAKYAVPDERVRGKRARITCKHCGTSIIVDGTSLGPSDGSVVAARPARSTMLGMGQVGSSAVAASSPRASSPLASVPSNAPPSGGSAWLVALADGRREPASQARIVDLYSAGTIDAASYIWREGMAEWKTPFQIPEIAGALAARGLKPRHATIPAAGEPDPDEATRVAINVIDDPAVLRARDAAARAATGTRESEPPEHDDGITIARSGPPSSPVSLPPLRAPSELPAARPRVPSAVRTTAPPSAEPPARKPSDPPPAAGRRPRAHTLPGDLVIPLTGPAAPPPTPLFAPRGQPFAARRTPSAPPGPLAPSSSAMVAPSAMIAPSNPAPFSSAPPAADAQAPFPSAPPAPAMPQPAQMPTPGPGNLPAPARAPADFEVPPRSAAPVSVPLEFTQGPQRRRRTLTAVVLLGVFALGGAGFAAYWKSKAPRPKPAAVAAVTTAPPAAAAPVPTPSAAEAEPAASVEAQPAAPSAEAAKPSARERAVARPAAAAARPASARKTEVAKPEATEAAPEAVAEGDSEAATARAEEAAKKAEEAAKKAEMQIGAGTAPFDRDAAATALSDAAMRAVSCRMLGGPTGSAQATVTFAPNGHVSAVSVGGDFAGSVVGACVGKLFRAASVPPFAGDPVNVAKRFTVE